MVHDNEWNKELCISWKHKKGLFSFAASFVFRLSSLAFDMLKKIRMYYFATKNNTYRMCNEILTRLRQGFFFSLKYEHNFLCIIFTYSLSLSLSHLQYSSSLRLSKQNFSNFAKDKVLFFFVVFLLLFHFFKYIFYFLSLSTISKQFYTIFVCDKQTSIKLQRSLKKKIKKPIL